MPDGNSKEKEKSQNRDARKKRRQRKQKNQGNEFLRGVYISEVAINAIISVGKDLYGEAFSLENDGDLTALLEDTYPAIQNSDLALKIIANDPSVKDIECPRGQSASDHLVSWDHHNSIRDRMSRE